MVVNIADPLTGQPLGGLFPQIWLVPDGGEAGMCQRWPGLLKSDGAGSPAIVDFTGFEIIQATRAGTIAVVDPDRRLGNADIRAALSLPASPSAWDFDPLRQALVAAIDGEAGMRLMRLNPLAERGTVALDGPASAVAIVGGRVFGGTRSGQVVSAELTGDNRAGERIGSASVILAKVGDDGLAAVSGTAGRFVAGPFAGTRFDFGVPVKAVSYAPLADALVALAADGSALFKLSLDNPAGVQRLELPVVGDAMAVDLAGRWLAVSSATQDEVVVNDLSTFVRTGRFTLDDPLVEFSFSDSFLYVMHQHGGVTRLWLDAPGGEPGIARIAAGPSYAAPDHASTLSRLARIPGHGMLVGVSRDRSAFQVNDGDAQAAHQRYSFKAGEPVGLFVNSRFPRETKPGQYELNFVPPYGGPHLAVIELDTPRTVECVPVAITGPSLKELRAAQAETTAPTVSGRMSTDRSGRTRITASIAPLDTVRRIEKAMLMKHGVGWFRYLDPVPVVAGAAEFPSTIDGDGPYELFLEVLLADGTVRTIRGPVERTGEDS